MSKTHGNEGFKQRFKQLLGIKKGHPISISIYDGPKTDEFTFTNELLQEMGNESPVATRVKLLKDLCEFLVNRKLEDHATEAAWQVVEDLLQHNHPQEARHVALQFLSVLVSCQFDRLHILRAHFFKIVVQHKIPDDFIPRIQLLRALSDNGKDITYFEEDIGTFLLSWMPDVIYTDRLEPLMSLLINVIHYNSSYLDENVVAGIVRENCKMARIMKNEKNVELSLCLLDAVVRYSSLPVGSVHEFISALCSTVNLENCCQHSWKIMRNVLGTHLGHRGVYTMCSIMESGGQQSSNVMQIRGAVFFIGMCLWGSQRVTTLKHSHSTVLPSMLQSLFCHHPIVSLEVTLSIQRLVKKYGHELHVVSWDSVLDITSKLQALIEGQPQKDTTLVENLHTLLNYIEELVESGKYRGSEERFYDIVEKCSSKRPESSLHLLVSFRAQSVHPAHAGWLNNLQNLMEKYFRYEIRTSVRVKALDVLSFVLTSYRHWYEEELLDRVVLPFLGNISDDQDVTVRTSAVQLLLDLSQTCDSPKCTDILNIIEKVISRRVELPGKVSPIESSQEEEALKDIKTAISALVQVFKVKLFRLPHSHAQKVFWLLVTHLRAHYYYGYSTNIASVIRNIVFQCFLSLRCDTSHRLGFVEDKSGEHDKVSLYYVCTQSALTSSSENKPSSSSPLGVIPYSDAFNVILNCLQYEWNWRVLEHVLSELPDVLQNKTLVLAADPSLNVMSSVLCKMVSDPATVLDLQQVPQGVGKIGFHALIFPVLTVLATYHFRLNRTHQCELVQSLELGFVSKCANLCVSSLMLCTMEMQAVMNSLLPAILVRLSQISATVSMAVPMLEFLSGLAHLPHLYASFKENQYKSVFAICLPYTDPFRYSQYTVTLAYHVITAWFVRARVAYRKDFVGFITKALKTNVTKPERHEQRSDSPALGLRSRSSSAVQPQPSSQSSTRSASPSSPMQAKETESAYEFHKEMSEVCMDMMARYSFAMSLSQPKRTAAMEFLLSKGKTRQWIVGNSVVSITTSGTYIELDGVCENCLALQKRSGKDSETAVRTSSASLLSKRRKSREKILEEYSLSAKMETNTAHDDKGVDGRSITSHDATLKPEHPKQSGRKSPVGEGGRVDAERSKTSETGDFTGHGSTGEGVKTKSRHGGSSDEIADCHCICQGWAEIVIRRPSGNISWTMRIQNRLVGPLLTMPEVDGDVTTALVDDSHIKEYLLVPDGETDQLKIRTKSREVLSTSTDSDVLLIDLIKKEKPKDTKDSIEEVVIEEPDEKDTPQASPESQQEEDEYLNTNTALSFQGFTPSSPSPIPYYSSGSEMGSINNRPRLLSNSPRRGPYAFRMTRHSESSDQFEHKSLPQDIPPSAKRQLRYEKPELGVSPAELDSTLRHLSQHDHHVTNTNNMYLSSSEMYRLASDDGDVKHTLEAGNKGESKHDGKTSPKPTESEFARPKDEPVKLRLKGEARAKSQRPKSLPLEFRPTGSSSDTSPTTQKPSHATGSHAKREREENHLKEESRDSHSASTSPRTPVKAKLKKSFSLSSPRRIRKNVGQSGESESCHVLRNTSADDMGYFSKANKSSSSPELSSPTLYRASILREFGKKKTPATGTKLHDTSGTSSKDGSEVPSTRDPPKLVPATESYRYPLDPNFVFLQLYQTSFSGSSTDKPIPLPGGEVIERAVKCLDRIPPYDTHKIGVIYVGPGQHKNETEILRNVYGSARYMKFISGLGSLIRLRDCPPAEIYMGGLDREGGDGEFAYSWQDSICQVIFHVATLMPTKDSDPGCNSKKMHIGNDFVTIVYNDSEENVAFGTIKGQFNFAELVITPLDNECNVIRMRFKEALKNLYVDTGPRVISDSNLPMLVRQLAIHINMASVLHQGQKRTTDAYGCNWLERLRQIKRLLNKAVTESVPPCTPPPSLAKSPSGSGAFGVVVPSTVTHPHLLDFTEYVANEKK